MAILTQLHKWAYIFMLILSGCGGGESEEAIQLTPFSESVEPAMAGDWPSTKQYYVIRDEGEWKNIWKQRILSLNCEIPTNKAACSMSDAPTIDFSTHILVGIYLGNEGFIDHDDNEVSASRDGFELVIRYFFLPSNLATSRASNSAFYLIGRDFDVINFMPI